MQARRKSVKRSNVVSEKPMNFGNGSRTVTTQGCKISFWTTKNTTVDWKIVDMAQGQIRIDINQPRMVKCVDCMCFVLDTEGYSRRNDTGEYFMGICCAGLCPDSPVKQFANKPRICAKFRLK